MADSELTVTLSMIDKITKPMGKVAKAMGQMGKVATKVGKSMTKNMTLPIIALGTASFKVFSDFETGMASVSTLVDTSTESMKDMGKQVQEIAKNTPVAMGQLTSALFDIRSASIPAADAMSVLERSAQLGVAGLGTTAQAARLAAGAINAWGLEGKDADKIFNTIFQTTKNGITTIAGLEQGFGAVAGKMAKAGIEADDYLASVAALTTTTLKASEAHTQMKAAVDGLEKSGKKTRKVFRKLGVKDFKELVKKTGSVTEAFRAVKGAVGDQSGALKDLIGSSEGAAAVSALVGAQGDKQLATLADMRKETEGLTDVQKAFNKQNKTSAAQWQRTKNSLTSAAISMGAILAPALTKIAKKIQEVAKWFSGLDDSTKKTIAQIAGVTAVVGPMLIVLGKVAPGVGIIITALKALAVVAAAHPMLALAVAIAAVAAYTAGDFSIAHDTEADREFRAIVEADPNSRVNRRATQAKREAALDQQLLADLGDEELGAPRAPEAPRKGPLVTASAWGIQAAGEFTKEVERRNTNGVGKGAEVADAQPQVEKNEIVIRVDGPGEVVSKKGPAKIDVKTGRQGAF